MYVYALHVFEPSVPDFLVDHEWWTINQMTGDLKKPANYHFFVRGLDLSVQIVEQRASEIPGRKGRSEHIVIQFRG